MLLRNQMTLFLRYFYLLVRCTLEFLSFSRYYEYRWKWIYSVVSSYISIQSGEICRGTNVQTLYIYLWNFFFFFPFHHASQYNAVVISQKFDLQSLSTFGSWNYHLQCSERHEQKKHWKGAQSFLGCAFWSLLIWGRWKEVSNRA